MSLQQWLDNSWIRKTERSAEQIDELLAIASRQIADASLEGISADGRFNHAYDAVRVLCELALHAAGYSVPKGGRQHERSIESLKFTLGNQWATEADYFDRCRRRRHESMYDRSGVTQAGDADELLARARELHEAVNTWLRLHHPDLVVD